MPVITGSTVSTVSTVASEISGVGSRRLRVMDNGWLIALTSKDDSYRHYLTVSKDNGATWLPVCDFYNSNDFRGSAAFATKGDFAYVLFNIDDVTIAYQTVNVLTQANATLGITNNKVIGTAGNYADRIIGMSMEINDFGEIHAVWSHEHATYASCYNISHAKAQTSDSGNLSFSTPENITGYASNSFTAKSPSIAFLANGEPLILFHGHQTSTGAYPVGRSVAVLKRDPSFGLQNNDGAANIHDSWSMKFIYTSPTTSTVYEVGNPSLIYVPSEVTGTPNGRLWASWDCSDDLNTSLKRGRYSYSDDNGVTWTPMQLSYNVEYSLIKSSLTANANNEVFLVSEYNNGTPAGITIGKFDPVTGYFTQQTATTGVEASPISLFDSEFRIQFTSPLYLYRDGTSTEFSGQWVITTISVEPGFIGNKTSKDSLLSYSIQTDGGALQVVEKLNGAIIRTHTMTNGQSAVVNLNSTQWDSLKYGSFIDANGGKNNITIEIGSISYEYIFGKTLSSDADLIITAKAVQDSSQFHLPSLRNKLAAKLNMPSTESFLTLIEEGNYGKGYAEGSTTYSSDTFTVTGLSFKTRVLVIILEEVGAGFKTWITQQKIDNSTVPTNTVVVTLNGTTLYSEPGPERFDVFDTGFTSYVSHSNWVPSAGATIKWYAYE